MLHLTTTDTSRALRWRVAATLLSFAGPMAVADARADCAIIPFSLSQPLVERFVFRPDTILQDYPSGGDKMEYAASIIAMSSRTALQPLITMALAGNQAQRKSLARSLAIAAKRCEKPSPSTAQTIDRMIKQVAEPSLRREFQSSYKSPATTQGEQAEKQRTAAIREAMKLPPPPEQQRALGYIGNEPNKDIGGVARIAPISPMR